MWRTYPDDFELLYYCLAEDEWAIKVLLKKYQMYSRKIVKDCIRQCRAFDMFKDDFIIETEIALIDSIRCYRDTQKCSFGTFYFTCAYRRVKSLARHHLRESNLSNLKAVSLDALISDESEHTFCEQFGTENDLNNPKFYTAYNEASLRVKETIETLKPRDKQVLSLYLDGTSYLEASKILGCEEKKFDNDVQKVKRKIRASALD